MGLDLKTRSTSSPQITVGMMVYPSIANATMSFTRTVVQSNFDRMSPLIIPTSDHVASINVNINYSSIADGMLVTTFSGV